MPICPRGHESQAEDWCDFCGFPMTPPPPAPPGAHQVPPGVPGAYPPPVAPPPFPGAHAPQPPAPAHPGLTEGLALCPICRSPQTGRFCEECGYDYELSTPSSRQPGPAHTPPAAHNPPPLNIPSAYGGAPQPPAAPAAPQPPAAGQPAAPETAYPHTYGYPPPEGAFPDSGLGEETSGPVYAGAPGPNNRGGDYGTSFHLAPPQGQPPAEPGPVRTNWIAVVAADRDYFTDMMARSGPEASGLFFPPYCPERRIPLTGRGQLRIGRRSQHRGTVPEIDLSVPPEDPGASHQHALLAEQADGSWVLVDQDSTNGTTVNGGAEPITPHTAVPLNDGDRIHIGAWTTITVHRA
ncbi:FHA domain-containing protein [Streptomyces sp. NRRL WC-3742]|uniref:FHA domain-containing protein n=1 Tax=Streptomyces sp. NRRL WC-3742 TaxID=1463934 RepID=UPI0004C66916|nr:FHA domain-containing protein [Streptomyces sp. NRRL WC-3742]